MSRAVGSVIITGASGGIGRASALSIAELGFDVVLTWHSSRKKVEEVAQEIRSKGLRAKAMRLCLEVDNIEEKFSEIDKWVQVPIVGLVNNAAINGGRVHFSEKSQADWKLLFQVNIFALSEMCRLAFNRMAISRGGAGGSIVNLSSQVAIFGGKNLTAYSASKGAVNSLTISLAKELGPDGIRVNAISPGLINSLQDPRNSQHLNLKISEIPLGRLGTPLDVAEAIAWLISTKSSFVSGAIIPVHGAR